MNVCLDLYINNVKDMNKTTIFTWFLLLLTFVSKIEGKNGPDPLVYTIPIKQEINHTTRLFLQHGMEEAQQLQADAILIDLNTYGGLLEAADSMRTALGLPYPVSFRNP